MNHLQPMRKRGRMAPGMRALLRCACALSTVAIWTLGAHDALAIDEGEPAPVFEAPALDGRGTVALDDHRGKVVYLDFWASWCPPCLESLPEIERLRGEFPEDQFQVVAVNVDKKPEKALKFLKRNPVGYPSASDPRGVLPKRYGLRTMPTSYLIDADGVVRYIHSGFRRQDVGELHARIKKMLAAR
jgi:thiol-disulfide isomerase/thioredoxin